MAYGDPTYRMVSSGCTATSAATAHNLFGGNGGLSLLNANEVVIIQVNASLADMRLSPGADLPATNDRVGIPLFTTDALFDFPPMPVTDASQITFYRLLATNAQANWQIWRRIP